MAKKAPALGNKSQAIRDALAANPDKSPKEIAELLSTQGYKLNAQYVSTIKSNAAAKSRGGRKVVRRRPGAASVNASPMTAALEFIRAAGGLAQAKSVLDTIEQIQSAL
jgi:hypothetical protein